MTSDFKAGATKINITPPLGTLINGDFISHYARFIHDELFARALLLKNMETQILFIVVDICLMDKEFVDEVKAAIARQQNIQPAQILISSTHTHAAGSVFNVLLGAADLNYRKALIKLLVKVGTDVFSKLKSAKIGFGSIDVPEHVLCRRYYMKDGFDKPNIITKQQDAVKTNPFGATDDIEKPAGPTDPQVSFIAIKDADDKWLSVLSNYSLHYVGDWDNGTISADYYGYYNQKVKDLLAADDDFMSIMSNGTSADINIFDFLNPDKYPSENFAKSKLIGEDIAGKVTHALKKIKWENNPKIAVNYTELELGVRKPNADELSAAKELVKETDYAQFNINNTGALEELYAREQVLLNEFPDVIQMPLQVFKIGNILIGGLASEFFAETGLKLKKDSPSSNYFSITMANGIFGYVPPADQMEKGGYETWRSRNSYLTVDAEEKVRSKMIELMNFGSEA